MAKTHHTKDKKSKNKAPEKCFSGTGEKEKDLLSARYSHDQRLRFSISTSTGTGVVLTSTAATQGRRLICSVAANYNYKNAKFKFIVDSQSNISTIIAFKKKFPPMQNPTPLKFLDYNLPLKISTSITLRKIFSLRKPVTSSKVLDYDSKGIRDSEAGNLSNSLVAQLATRPLISSDSNEISAFSMSIALNQSPAVYLSATIGCPSIAFGMEAKYNITSGMEAKYNITSGCLSQYKASIGMRGPDSNASIVLTDKGDLLKASYVKYLNQSKRISALAEITRRFSTKEDTFTVGGDYIFDGMTTVRARLNNDGKLRTLLQHKTKHKSILKISSEFNIKALDKVPKIGLAIALRS